MGRAARWFRNFLGLKNPSYSPSSSSQPSAPVKHKRGWSFVRSHRKPPSIPVDGASDRLSGKDHAALGGFRGREVTAVVGTRCGRKRELDGEDAAAVAIQSAFRGYLARRALRALKGLVKIQALVRGYMVRKRTAEWLSHMQALLRAQARACVDRAPISASSQSTSKCLLFAQHPGPSTPERLEPSFQTNSSVRNQSPVLRKSWSSSETGRNWIDRNVDRKVWDQRGGPSTGIGCSGDNDRGNEIPVTCGNTRNSGSIARTSRHLHRASHSFTAWKDSSYCEASAAYPVGFLTDEAEFCAASNSPQFYSAALRSPNLRRSPFTPYKSIDTRNYFCGYSDYPNYMSYTESSRAKVRSASAPRQRPHFEKSGSGKRNSMHGFSGSRLASHKSSSALNKSSSATFTTGKAYLGSGRLDHHGMPIRGGRLGYRRVY